MSKTDHTLGLEVHNYLLSKGVETPMKATTLNHAIKRANIEDSFKSIMLTLGLDLTDDSLKDTPSRVAKMFVDEIFYGMDYEKFPKCTAIENKMAYDEMICERNINVMSNCEHHNQLIYGKATVAYIPNKMVLGLSKLNRIVDFFARRPQVQERLTEQIYFALEYILGTDSVAVVIDAEHFCVKARGIQDVGSSTVTSKLGGLFRDPAVRAEFFQLANKR